MAVGAGWWEVSGVAWVLLYTWLSSGKLPRRLRKSGEGPTPRSRRRKWNPSIKACGVRNLYVCCCVRCTVSTCPLSVSIVVTVSLHAYDIVLSRQIVCLFFVFFFFEGVWGAGGFSGYSAINVIGII